MIKRIKSIQGFATFKDFTWDSDNLKDFSEYNIIYGWNGSGKTTLSRIFSWLGESTNNSETEASVSLKTSKDGVVRLPDDLPEKAYDNIRVFNEDFVESHLFWDKSGASPILIVSEDDDVESKLGELNRRKSELEAEISNVEDSLKEHENEKEEVIKSIRSEIENTIANYVGGISPRSDADKLGLEGTHNQYKNYNKTDIEEMMKNAIKSNKSYIKLGSDQKANLEKSITENKKRDKIDVFNIKKDHFDGLESLVESISQYSGPASGMQIKKEISESDEGNLKGWLDDGEKLHDLEEGTECKFCKNKIQKERIEELTDYFNPDYRSHIDNIDKAISEFKGKFEKIKELPEAEKLYSDLRGEYRKKKENFQDTKSNLLEIKEDFLKELKKEKQDHNTPVLNLWGDFLEELQNLSKNLDQVNDVLIEHNKKTDDFNNIRERSAHWLETGILAKNQIYYKRKVEKIQGAKARISELKDELNEIMEEIEKIKNSLDERGPGADKFNEYLNSFLGYAQIKLTPADNREGYRIIRGSGADTTEAENLSEGEKNAIALIFFLVKLEEDDFDSDNSIIVIDDPVSSLDSKNLYQAYGFIKARIGDISPEQVFFLTHKLDFLNHLQRGIGEANSYMLKEKYSEDIGRFSAIKPLDRLLRDYESEYVYFFKCIYKRANNDPESMEEDYLYPNILRKFLESYLSFKVPSEPGSSSISTKFKKFRNDHGSFDEYLTAEEEAELIERYCQEHSHPEYFESQDGFSEDMLAGLTAACSGLNKMIENTDKNHYEHLCRAIGEPIRDSQ